ncbi:MAG: AbrB/MazE/SpoVT family DNA-binding domain-containing protein [Bacillota bacterium]|nr:AbrB/MazE/SpoVT family DNA-binding domain-containing protein [Bacillota bacterium]
MKSTGIVREIDSLGRIVLPKSIRNIFDMKPKDSVEIYTEGSMVILKKYAPFCVFCEGSDDIVYYKGKNVCKKCVQELTSIE